MASFNNKDRLFELLHKKIFGGLLLPERTELSELLKVPENELISSFFEEVFSSERVFIRTDYQESQERVRHNLFGKIQKAANGQENKRNTYLKYLSIAALLLFLVGMSVIFIQFKEIRNPVDSIKTISASTNKGSKTSLVLPDGTKVWINADTKLTYGEDFGNKDRSVNLTGEAYFDVAKDPSRPFLVHTKYAIIKALGTSFNVKAYPESPRTENSLIEGLVEVTLTRDSKKKIILKPKEKLSVINQPYIQNEVKNHTPNQGMANITITDLVKPVNDSLVLEAQWTKNRLVFQNMKLEDVAKELSRWYNLEVRVYDDKLKANEYSGIFEGESITEVIEALKLTGGFDYKIDKNVITILP